MRVSIASEVMRAAVLTMVLLASATGAGAQQLNRRLPKAAPAQRAAGRWMVPTMVRPAAASLADRNEVEPNDSIVVAMAVTLGDDVIGKMDVADDVDWFAIDLTAGTVIEFEIFAQRNGSALDSYMALVAPDRTTTIVISDDAVGTDSRIRLVVPATGRYFVGLTDYYGDGGPTYTYRLHFGTASAAPGDPPTRTALGLGSAWGATALANGDLLVADQDGRVLRVTPTGTVSTYLSNIGVPFDVALDGLGDVLVAGELTAATSGVTRIKPDGTRSVFATGLQSARAITIGPDGDVWVANPVSRRLHRYAHDGTPKTAIDLPTFNTSLLDIAFSPSGVLHVSDFISGIFRIVNNAPVRMITFTGLGGLAFDRDGYIYLGTAQDGVRLYDPNGVLVNGPFASFNLNLPGNVVFARDATGAMTNRLYAINVGDGTLYQLNPAGVRAPGFRVGIDLLLFAQDSITRGIMGAQYSHTLRVTNFTGPIAWTVDSGTLPPGVALGVNTGVLAGVPAASGTFSFVARATGSGGRFGTMPVTVTINRPTLSMSDATNHLLGITGVLSSDLLRFLDLQGNKNGRFDSGDLQTYLRAEGRIR
jgi:sugar lactone lactonase YvrE